MLGAFAKQYIRPVAMKHDREESMPWALMKQAQIFGMTQTAVVDGRKALTGKDDEEGAGKPKSQSRLGVVGSEELAYGCAGVCLAIGGSGLAASPVARMGTEEQKQEFRRLLKADDDDGNAESLSYIFLVHFHSLSVRPCFKNGAILLIEKRLICKIR